MSDEWPLPPLFMWACGTCVDLLRRLPGALVESEDDPGKLWAEHRARGPGRYSAKA